MSKKKFCGFCDRGLVHLRLNICWLCGVQYFESGGVKYRRDDNEFDDEWRLVPRGCLLILEGFTQEI